MKVIHKYQLPVLTDVEIEMPKDAYVFKGDLQDGIVVVWAVVDTEKPMVKRRFKLLKTGQEIIDTDPDPMGWVYTGIAIIKAGMDLGLHMFEGYSHMDSSMPYEFTTGKTEDDNA